MMNKEVIMVIEENGIRYEGDVLNGEPHGKGVCFFDGNKYEGEWQNGDMCGYGKLILENGVVYEGEFKDNLANGKGTKTFEDKSRYEGEWKNGVCHGKGIYYWANGDRYEGEWQDGKMQGKGKYYWANGDIYEGEWVDSAKQGQGTAYFADGCKYTGEWQNGFINGKGVYSFPSGARYEGEFKNGTKHGKGKDFDKEGRLVFDGEYIEGKQVFLNPAGKIQNNPLNMKQQIELGAKFGGWSAGVKEIKIVELVSKGLPAIYMYEQIKGGRQIIVGNDGKILAFASSLSLDKVVDDIKNKNLWEKAVDATKTEE